MRHYDNPLLVTYTVAATTFGSAFQLKPPKGLTRGTIFDIHVMVTATFTAVTTPASVQIGYTGSANYYAELNMGTAASGTSRNSSDILEPEVVVKRPIFLRDDPGVGSDLTHVLLTSVAPTGGTPAGGGVISVPVGWY